MKARELRAELSSKQANLDSVERDINNDQAQLAKLRVENERLEMANANE